MKYTMFATPTEFDMRSMNVQGMSAKPNSDNPIGRFGSGLKYAIAILLRVGAKLTLHCNGNHYEFYLRGEDFRGNTFDRVCYRRTSGLTKMFDIHDLPFTTDLGKHWELWQAFRELYANTTDEGGWCDLLSIETLDDWHYEADWTYILVEHLEFARLVPVKDTIFLNPERPLIVDTHDGNVAPEKSQNLYFRGMRAFDLPKDEPAQFTYNVIAETELTEDRTIKNIYEYKDHIEKMVERSEDKDFIKAVLTAPDESFEKKRLNFEYASPGTVFKEVLTSLRDDKRLNPSAGRYYGTYIAPPKRKLIEDDKWSMILAALDDGAEALGKDNSFADDTIAVVHAEYVKAFQKKFDR